MEDIKISYRDNETIGTEAQVPGANIPTPLRRNEIAAGNSGSPYNGDFQHEQVYTGNGDGGAGDGEERGIITPKGSGISVSESSGSETVAITHHSGASVAINDDGTVVITGASQKGVAIDSQGDFAIGATSVAIDSKAGVSIKTNGNLTLDVGGDLIMKVKGSLIEKVGNKHELVEGGATREVVKDENTIIGGIKRTTIAGDERHQVTGTLIEDIGADSTRRVGGDSLLSSTGNLSLTTAGNYNASASGSSTIHSSGIVYVTGSDIKVSPWVDRAKWSAEANEATIAGVVGTVTVNEPPPETGSSIDSVDPEYSEAEDIVDEMTSARKIPEYPRNAIYETAEVGSIGTVSYDTSQPALDAYNQYSSKNAGSMHPVTSGSWDGNLEMESGYSDYETNNSILSEEVQGNIPTSTYNPNDNVAGGYMSELVNAPYSHPIPQSLKESVLAAHAVLIQNVLIPLRRAGFTDFKITNAYRGNSPNHKTGYTFDLQTPSRSFAKHVAIAEFAARNLPCKQVFLEKSGSGFSHVHIRVHPPGQSGSPTLLTCGSPACSSGNRVAGIKPEWLRRKVRG